MNEASERFGELVVSRREAPGILELVEASFDAVSQRVDGSVDLDLDAAISLRGNDGMRAALFEVFSYGVGVVAAIAEHDLGIGRWLFHQRLVALHVVGLAGRKRGGERKPPGVGAQMDFRREATARTAKSVSLNPPLPPAAQWCARTMVESII